MTPDFTDQTVIVTGAAGGIGRATVHALLEAHAKVVAVDIAEAGLDDLKGECAVDRLLTLALDVSCEADMEAMAACTVETFGGLNALVAAAGILRTSGQPTPMADTGYDEWRKIIDVNLTGTFLSNRAVLPAMLAAGQGDIVNVSSTSGLKGRPFDGPYSTSKFGILGLSESLAAEVHRQGVRVQTILPDAVDTPLWDQSGTASIRPRQMLAPERVAGFILYLIGLPRDMFLLNCVVGPIRTRIKRKKS